VYAKYAKRGCFRGKKCAENHRTHGRYSFGLVRRPRSLCPSSSDGQGDPCTPMQGCDMGCSLHSVALAFQDTGTQMNRWLLHDDFAH
jgi:hypothetical protein